MTAPAVTARTTPTGSMLKNGYQALVAFASDADVDLWEKSVTPPGASVPEAIDLTTMHNTAWETKAFDTIKSLKPMKMTCGYDPKVIDQIIALLGVEGAITLHYPSGASLSFYGALQDFEPSELVRGKAPEAAVTITPTNRDPVANVEAAPVYTAAGSS